MPQKPLGTRPRSFTVDGEVVGSCITIFF